MHPFTWASLAGYAVVVLAARLQRGAQYATFVGVLLGVHTLIAVTLAPHVAHAAPALGYLFAYLQAAVLLHFVLLARPRMRPLAYRALVSVPASWFAATTLLAFPWAIAAAVGLRPVALWLPYALGFVGLLDSLFGREEVVDVVLDAERHADGEPASLRRVRKARAAGGGGARPLRIVQITDPHLGPFMSERRLRKICERAVAREPDLVLLTGDFLTMESQSDPEILGRALAPLRPLAGRTFACLGNHDHEAPEVVARGLSSAGVTLLVDAAATVATPHGTVEILGFDFAWRERAAHLARVCAAHPRKDPDALRVALLHDPGAFKHLPHGAADLVLSGHTHGGQIGLLRLGLAHTVVSALTEIPDHGLWARGRDRLYVHRGTGHYGFPLRLGVPAEQSLLQVHRAAAVERE